MPIAITLGVPINELNSWSFTADLTKDDGTALGPTALETLTLTLYDVATNAIINAVDHWTSKTPGAPSRGPSGREPESAETPIATASAEGKHRR
jgi:hypothetical protein